MSAKVYKIPTTTTNNFNSHFFRVKISTLFLSISRCAEKSPKETKKKKKAFFPELTPKKLVKYREMDRRLLRGYLFSTSSFSSSAPKTDTRRMKGGWKQRVHEMEFHFRAVKGSVQLCGFENYFPLEKRGRGEGGGSPFSLPARKNGIAGINHCISLAQLKIGARALA